MRKSITLDGLTLSYLEKNETSPHTLFFIHGNSGSSRLWKKQLECDLLDKYRLVAIDLPGHGHSSGSENPFDDYSPIGTAQILSEAIKEIARSQPYILVGFSYGTNLIAEMLACGLKPVGMIMMGMCVIGKDYGMEKVFKVDEQQPSIFFRNEPDRAVVEQFIKHSLVGIDDDAASSFADDYYATKPLFRTALMQGAADGKISDEMGWLLKQDVPVCIIFGQADNLVRIDYLDHSGIPVWRQIHKLPDAGHWVNLDNPKQFNQLVTEYAAEMFTANLAAQHSWPTP